MAEIPRAQYRALYGPTAGDRIRLADTDLLIEVAQAALDYRAQVIAQLLVQLLGKR